MLQKTGAVIDVIITYCARKSGANVGFPPAPADYQRRLEGLVYGRQRTNVGPGGSGKVRPTADLRKREILVVADRDFGELIYHQGLAPA